MSVRRLVVPRVTNRERISKTSDRSSWVPISARVPADWVDAFDDLAYHLRSTRSEFIVEALDRYLVQEYDTLAGEAA